MIKALFKSWFNKPKNNKNLDKYNLLYEKSPVAAAKYLMW